MIVNSNRHHFFCIILADHILVKTGLDLMGSRYVFQSEGCFFLFFLLFLLLGFFRFLNRVGAGKQVSEIHILQTVEIKIGQVEELDSSSRESFPESIKRFLHTVRADTHVIGHVDQSSSLGFAAMADTAVFRSLLLRAFIIVIFVIDHLDFFGFFLLRIFLCIVIIIRFKHVYFIRSVFRIQRITGNVPGSQSISDHIFRHIHHIYHLSFIS